MAQKARFLRRRAFFCIGVRRFGSTTCGQTPRETHADAVAHVLKKIS